MKRYLYHLLTFVLIAVLTTACSNKADEPDNGDALLPLPTETKNALLIYAVASNSLDGNFGLDLNEIIKIAPELGGNKSRILIYTVRNKVQPVMMEIRQTRDKAVTDTLKKYDMVLPSVANERISEVIADFRQTVPDADKYGLILWSHSTGWLPGKDVKWFGEDKNNGNNRGEITEVAKAIPDNVFDFIWFDSCYMANIEAAYEFRNKCHYYIGYATEIWADGMPYNLTLPYITASTPDFAAALNASKEYYGNRAYTGAVMDMTRIDDLADAARPLLNSGTPLLIKSNLLMYSRSLKPALYDFGQVAVNTANQNGVSQAEIDRFKAALDNFVIYKVASEANFNGQIINPLLYSGLSTSIFDTADESGTANFYRTFAWYNRIYGQQED